MGKGFTSPAMTGGMPLWIYKFMEMVTEKSRGARRGVGIERRRWTETFRAKVKHHVPGIPSTTGGLVTCQRWR